jgi:hypothetical protein
LVHQALLSDAWVVMKMRSCKEEEEEEEEEEDQEDQEELKQKR